VSLAKEPYNDRAPFPQRHYRGERGGFFSKETESTETCQSLQARMCKMALQTQNVFSHETCPKETYKNGASFLGGEECEVALTHTSPSTALLTRHSSCL